MNTLNTFKVGDKVRIVKTGVCAWETEDCLARSELALDEIHTVVEARVGVGFNDEPQPCVVLEKSRLSLSTEHFELVE